jgi:hypothetical protein
LKGGADNGFVDPEALGAEPKQIGLKAGDSPRLPGRQQDSDRAADRKSARPGEPSTVEIVNQQKGRVSGQRKRDRGGLPGIDLTGELAGEGRGISGAIDLDPGGGPNRLDAGGIRATVYEFAPNDSRQDHAAEHLAEKVEPPDPREIEQRGRVCDDDLAAPR